MITKKTSLIVGLVLVCNNTCIANANETGLFDMDRWNTITEDIRMRAKKEGISDTTIKQTMQAPAFIPSIVKSDKNQSEFKLTMAQYLEKTVNQNRIIQGKKMRTKYPSLLNRTENIYGIQPHVILAFWGMESNYGDVKARHKLKDAFFTLIYEGRRKTFFENQLIALMKTTDKNQQDINNIHGSWAGAMGHFQFIPTTLTQYGVDGNGDKKIDIINNISDAMASAGNYLNKLGWNKNERIARRVILPADFDLKLADGKSKKKLAQWAKMGIKKPDGTPIPITDMDAGIVADITTIEQTRNAVYDAQNAIDTDVAPQPVAYAYLTYPNFYRIKKWNNSNWYAIAISELSDALRQ